MILIKPSYNIKPCAPFAIQRSIEAAGRTCYKSEGKATDNSAGPFIQKIIKRGHESVLEHESLSVRFIVDRGVTHELVRHRLAAYSQESTRYCDYSGGVTFIIPPWTFMTEGEHCIYWNGIYGTPEYPGRVPTDEAEAWWFWHCAVAERDYLKLLSYGWSPQQARSVLPNSLKTEIVMTANLREWRHVLRLRAARAAHPQMQEIMRPLLNDFKKMLPSIFSDIECE